MYSAGQNAFQDGSKYVDSYFLIGLSLIDRPTVWYLTDVVIIVGCRIHFWTDVLRCCGGKFSILTYEDEGGTEFCATWRCRVQNLISSCLTHPAHRQGKHKVMAKNLNLKEKSIWVPYNFVAVNFLGRGVSFPLHCR